MTETPSQADRIIAFWPGETILEKRRALYLALGYSEARVRYWHTIGFIPQDEHQKIIDLAAERGIRIPPTAFSQHLEVPGRKTPAAAAAG